MTLKAVFDVKMIVVLVTCGLLVSIMSRLSPPGNLDVRLFYSNLDGNFFLRGLAPEALNNYRFTEYLDLFFIFNYTQAMLLTLRRRRPESLIWLIALVPGVFDLVETGTIIAALHRNPPFLPVPNLGMFTCLKWVSIAGVLPSVFWCLFRAPAKD